MQTGAGRVTVTIKPLALAQKYSPPSANRCFFSFFSRTLQAQWKPASGGSSPQLSGSSAAPWTLARAPARLGWAPVGRRAGTRPLNSGGWACRLWGVASVLSPGSPACSERRVGSNTYWARWPGAAGYRTSTRRGRWRKLCAPWPSSARPVSWRLETWWGATKELWEVWRTWRSQWEQSDTKLLCYGVVLTFRVKIK